MSSGILPKDLLVELATGLLRQRLMFRSLGFLEINALTGESERTHTTLRGCAFLGALVIIVTNAIFET